MSPKVWLITGSSSGLGLSFCLAALSAGDHVIATARRLSSLTSLAEKGAKTLELDVTASKEKIEEVVKEAVGFYGRIDVLVNNAGYILIAGHEETSPEMAQKLYDTNVFGLIKVTNAVLPYMRSQKSGVIANIGSVGGWEGNAGCPLYNSTKYAVAGLSLSLRAEVELLGIQVTSIDYGYFRTNLLDPSASVQAEDREDASYTSDIKNLYKGLSKKQPGDPRKAAEIVVEILTGRGRGAGKKIPGRLAMGRDATKIVQGAITRSQQELDEWKDIVSTTDHDDVAQE